jgi:hypothetical protein
VSEIAMFRQLRGSGVAKVFANVLEFQLTKGSVPE